jgi:hypothetical protein
VAHKYTMVARQGMTDIGAQMMARTQKSVGPIGRKELSKLSRNVMFDRGSFEDLKKFSNTLES